MDKVANFGVKSLSDKVRASANKIANAGTPKAPKIAKTPSVSSTRLYKPKKINNSQGSSLIGKIRQQSTGAL